MWTHPGKKLLFMGQEIGQREEWNHNTGVRWELLEFDCHRKLQALARELNRLYRENPALYQVDFHYSGFEWVDFHDWENSIISFLRRAEDPAAISCWSAATSRPWRARATKSACRKRASTRRS